MENNMQTSSTESGSNKIVLTVVVILVLVAAVIGWWFIYSDGWFKSSPAAESNSDLNDLNSIGVDDNIDAEFQQIDKDINNL